MVVVYPVRYVENSYHDSLQALLKRKLAITDHNLAFNYVIFSARLGDPGLMQITYDTIIHYQSPYDIK